MFQNTAGQEQFVVTQGNKTVKVTAVFPEQSDPAAEQELVNRLRELYFRGKGFPFFE